MRMYVKLMQDAAIQFLAFPVLFLFFIGFLLCGTISHFNKPHAFAALKTSVFQIWVLKYHSMKLSTQYFVCNSYEGFVNEDFSS